MTQYNQDFKMVAGDTKSILVPVLDEDTGAPVDTTGATASFKIHKRGTDYVTKTVGSGITVGGGASNNEVTVSLAAGDTATLEGVYDFQLELTDTSSNVFTPTVGEVTFVKDIA